MASASSRKVFQGACFAVRGESILGSIARSSAARARIGKPYVSMSALRRPPYEQEYQSSARDPLPNHETKVAQAKINERKNVKYIRPSAEQVKASMAKLRRPEGGVFDAIIIGAGHNGLIASAYLAKQGLKDVLVLERRSLVGGAAVTEELVPGFKFSRASYLAGLLRPDIITDLQLERFGFEYLARFPSSFTPTRREGEYLFLGGESEAEEIAKFSEKDAANFAKYEEFLGACREMLQPLLDSHPPEVLGKGLPMRERLQALRTLANLGSACWRHRQFLPSFYELFTGPSQQILDRWFESEILKTTLATDAVIGALISPKQAGSSYVLLHHVMGEAAGRKGVWAYVRGGMGTVSNSIAESAKEKGVQIACDADVNEILLESGSKLGRAAGVRLLDGTELRARKVISACTPYQTFLEMMPWDKDELRNRLMCEQWDAGRQSSFLEQLSGFKDYAHQVWHTDFACGAFKINCAISELPEFKCLPRGGEVTVGPEHMGTIHFEEKMEEIDSAYREASRGIPATKPVIEMTIPSSVDDTLAPKGQHVAQLFIQFAPYDVDPKVGSWADPEFKRKFVERVFSVVDEYTVRPFSESVIGYDALSPLDLERTFSLHKGNIFHSSLALHQLAYARPVPGFSSHRTPIEDLYLCASGTHPGGGVMGAPGRNCANVVLNDLTTAGRV